MALVFDEEKAYSSLQFRNPEDFSLGDRSVISHTSSVLTAHSVDLESSKASVLLFCFSILVPILRMFKAFQKCYDQNISVVSKMYYWLVDSENFEDIRFYFTFFSLFRIFCERSSPIWSPYMVIVIDT